MSQLRLHEFYDLIEETTTIFHSDVEDHVLETIPEIEWYAVKGLLLSWGYKAIETDLN